MPRMLLLLVVVCGFLLACGDMPGPVDGGAGGGRAGGSAGGGSAGGFTVIDLDPDARGLFWHAMAVDPTDARVVVAYYAPRGTRTVMDVDDLDLKVVEWRDGQVTNRQTLRFMQRTAGLSVAIHPMTKEPTVGFLGGSERFVPGASIFWFQSDAALFTRTGTTWTETTVRTDGDICTSSGSPMNGSVVGLWPALRFDAAGRLVFVWRDIRFGQNPTDYTGSDLESVDGPLGSLTPRCVYEGFTGDKVGRGARLMLAPGPNDETLLVYDQQVQRADTTGQDVVLQRRLANGTWTAPTRALASPNTQTGPQVAFDAMEGAGVAVIRGSTLIYRRLPDVADPSGWEAEQQVVSEGSGGWYPSLAISPLTHEPSLAFYSCSRTSGVPESDCQTSQDALRLSTRAGSQWPSPVTVDDEGGWLPKLGVLASGKRVIVYRVPNTRDQTRAGALKLAVER
ncbi:MAG: hypothetical protein SFW67_20695 [Myxococcaceae bacterium]|nr:hypothetical protein [Myxococcaceae bacterium]